jgi:hypothetical protein
LLGYAKALLPRAVTLIHGVLLRQPQESLGETAANVQQRYLVGELRAAPKLTDHHLQALKYRSWMPLEEFAEGAPRQKEDRRVIDRCRRSRARFSVEKRELTKVFARFAKPEDQLVTLRILARDAHMTLHDDVQPIARISMRENELIPPVPADEESTREGIQLVVGDAPKQSHVAQYAGPRVGCHRLSARLH